MVRRCTDHPRLSSPMSMAQLEQQLQRKLHNPWRIRRRDRAKPLQPPRIRTDLLCVSDISVGQPKLRMIEGVKQFGAELQIHAFPDESVFQQSHIPIVVSRVGEESWSRITQASQSFWTEQCCVEIWRCCRTGITDVKRALGESGCINRKRDGPGAGGTQKRIVIRFHQRNGKSGSKPCDAAQPPA